MGDEPKQKWIEAMQDEMKSLHDNKTFVVDEVAKRQDSIGKQMAVQD